MPNYVSQQSFYNRMQENENPASIFGFDPEKYGQYFEPYENIEPELEFTRRQTELTRQGIGLQRQGAEQGFQSQVRGGTQSLFDLVQQAQGLRGRSGFGAFGAAEKAMSSNADRLRKALETVVSQYGTQMGGYDLAGKQAGLAEERDIYGTKRSFYQDAIQSAIDLLRSGVKPTEPAPEPAPEPPKDEPTGQLPTENTYTIEQQSVLGIPSSYFIEMGWKFDEENGYWYFPTEP